LSVLRRRRHPVLVGMLWNRILFHSNSLSGVRQRVRVYGYTGTFWRT